MQHPPALTPADATGRGASGERSGADALWRFGAFELRAGERVLLQDGRPVKLGGRAFDLLVALVERRDRVALKSELLDLVWPHLVVEENNLQVHVLALRKLLGPQAIATVPGRGYRFTAAAHGADALGQGGDGVLGSSGPASPVASDRGNLPHWQQPLHGRAEDLQALLACMHDHALTTLVGPSGVGKSCLARAAARQWAATTQQAVWWVDLAALTDPVLVPRTVALALGARSDAAANLAVAVTTRLTQRDCLLVLDNVEQVADGVAGFLAQLRPQVSHVRLLLTSQEALHCAEEQVFRVEPLSLPNDASLAAAEASGAVQLFVARARGEDRHFTLNAENLVAVTDICRGLDGIALAIELAAARLPLLGLQGLRTRLHERFQLLTLSERSAASRYRTLREAVQWSYQLLTTDEQAVFRRLAVFVGGFTLEASQAVAADTHSIDNWAVLDLLGRLVDKSLVLAEGGDLPRYRLLETLRLFAMERLIEHGESDVARTAHRDHYVLVAEAAHQSLRQGHESGMAVLDLERENLFTALSWKRGADAGPAGLRLVEALDAYWLSRGLLAFGLAQCRAALEHPQAQARSSLRCRAELCAAGFCTMLGHLDEALEHARSGMRIAVALDDADCRSFALVMRAQIDEMSGDLVSARKHGEEGLQEARRTGAVWPLRRALMSLAGVHDRCGHWAAALAMEEEALALCRTSGLWRLQAEHHLNLAWMNCQRENPSAVSRHLGAVEALLPRMDSEYFGLAFVRTAASWATALRRHEVAVQCFAAYALHAARIGLSDPLESWEQDHQRESAAALDEAALDRANGQARFGTYVDALRAATTLITEREQ